MISAETLELLDNLRAVLLYELLGELLHQTLHLFLRCEDIPEHHQHLLLCCLHMQSETAALGMK